MTDNIYTTSVSFAEARQINDQIGAYYTPGTKYTNGVHTICVKQTEKSNASGYDVYFSIIIDDKEYIDEDDEWGEPYFCKNSALLYKNGYKKCT